MAEQGLGAKQAKRDVRSGSGWLSFNRAERMKVTTDKSERGVIRGKERGTVRVKGHMWVYLCLWRLRPCGRNSGLCPRRSRSLGR